MITSTSYRSLLLAAVLWIPAAQPVDGSEPTLARFSLWASPEQMPEVEIAYRQKVVPILRAHGMAESAERGRSTPDSVFSRLYVAETPSQVAGVKNALQTDTAWQSVVKDLGARFGQSNESMPYVFELYSTPAGPGKTAAAGTGKGHWRNFGIKEGLTGGLVRDLLQDRNGTLWFASMGGVNRYDGKSWTTFKAEDGLAGNRVYACFEDRQGYLWFGTDRGVSRYDGENWVTFTTSEGLVGDEVRAICQDRNGSLWFGTWDGVSRYDGSTWTSFTTEDGLVSNAVHSLFQDSRGYVWVMTTNGVSRYDGDTFTTFTAEEHGLAANNLRGGCEDRNGNIWFGTGGGGASRFDGQTFTTFKPESGFVLVWDVYQDHAGDFWFGTPYGLYRLRLEGGKEIWQKFSTDDGLAVDWVESILEDRDGLLWLGTAAGASVYSEEFTRFTTQDGLQDDGIAAMFEDRAGQLWFGTRQGVCRYDGDTFKTLTTADGLVDNSVISVLQDQTGNLWFGTNGGGVSRYDGHRFTTFSRADGLPGNSVWTMCLDKEGNIWFGTLLGGIGRYDGQRFTRYEDPDGHLRKYVFSTLADREGNVWFGGDHSFNRYDGQEFTAFTAKDGVAANAVHAAFQDREGVLWFGSAGGVTRYDGESASTITTSEGLTESWVFSIVQDRGGDLWFGTMNGARRYDGRVVQILSDQDGLAQNYVLRMLEDQDGNLWFGSPSGGLTRYSPRHSDPPPVFVSSVVADRRYTGVSEVALAGPVELLGFELEARSIKTRPEAMIFRYRLTGFDSDWKTTLNRRVEYHDLPRGTYTFEVVAVDRDLVYSESPATVTLTVHFPYERIAWISALGIAVVLIGWQTMRVVRRDRNLQESNAALSSTNKDLFNLNSELQQKS